MLQQGHMVKVQASGLQGLEFMTPDIEPDTAYILSEQHTLCAQQLIIPSLATSLQMVREAPLRLFQVLFGGYWSILFASTG